MSHEPDTTSSDDPALDLLARELYVAEMLDVGPIDGAPAEKSRDIWQHGHDDLLPAENEHWRESWRRKARRLRDHLREANVRIVHDQMLVLMMPYEALGVAQGQSHRCRTSDGQDVTVRLITAEEFQREQNQVIDEIESTGKHHGTKVTAETARKLTAPIPELGRRG